jgi:drug/metabolite transporter (DMT)-like permease
MIELIVLGAVWGFSFIFLRIAVPAIGASATTFLRLVLAVFLLLFLAKLFRAKFPWRTHGKQIIGYGLVNTAIPFLLFGLASKHLPAGYLAVLNGTAALFSALLAVVWLKQPLTSSKWLGLVLGVLGVAVLVGLAPLALTGAVMFAVGGGLLGALFYATAGHLTPRLFSGVPPYALAYASLIPASVALLPIAAMNVPPAHAFSSGVIVAVLFLGLVTTGLAYFLYFRVLDRLGPVRTSTVAFLIPVFALLWGWVFLGEPITSANVIGGAMVLLGVAFVQGIFTRQKA